MKKCSKCGEVKTLEEFCKHIRYKDGYRNICKICRNQRELELKNNKSIENSEYTRSERATQYMVDNIHIDRDELCYQCVEKYGLTYSTLITLYYQAMQEAREIMLERKAEIIKTKEDKRKKFYFDDSNLVEITNRVNG